MLKPLSPSNNNTPGKIYGGRNEVATSSENKKSGGSRMGEKHETRTNEYIMSSTILHHMTSSSVLCYVEN